MAESLDYTQAGYSQAPTDQINALNYGQSPRYDDKLDHSEYYQIHGGWPSLISHCPRGEGMPEGLCGAPGVCSTLGGCACGVSRVRSPASVAGMCGGCRVSAYDSIAGCRGCLDGYANRRDSRRIILALAIGGIYMLPRYTGGAALLMLALISILAYVVLGATKAESGTTGTSGNGQPSNQPAASPAAVSSG